MTKQTCAGKRKTKKNYKEKEPKKETKYKEGKTEKPSN